MYSYRLYVLLFPHWFLKAWTLFNPLEDKCDVVLRCRSPGFPFSFGTVLTTRSHRGDCCEPKSVSGSGLSLLSCFSYSSTADVLHCPLWRLSKCIQERLNKSEASAAAGKGTRRLLIQGSSSGCRGWASADTWVVLLWVASARFPRSILLKISLSLFLLAIYYLSHIFHLFLGFLNMDNSKVDPDGLGKVNTWLWWVSVHGKIDLCTS